jgi:hypothetical protein
MMAKDKIVSSSLLIKAPVSKIFDFLANPQNHLLIDGSGQLQDFIDVPERLFLGAKFSMDIKMGPKYKVTNTVIEFEENKVIAWKHFGRHVWKYELEDKGDNATLVTESWNWGTMPFGTRTGIEILGFPKKNLENIRKTLEKIAILCSN